MKNNISKIIQGKKQQGFTLIELAIVIVIVGILLVGLFQGIHLYLEQKKINDTDSNINAVRVALSDYIRNERNATNPNDQRRFPCPSSLTGSGVGNSELANCTSYAVTPPAFGEISGSGVWAVNTPSGRTALVGGVPTGTLKLPAKYVYDGYGNRLVYAITLDLVADDVLVGSTIPDGAIVVESFDPNGSGGVSTQTANFVVFSPGKTKQGAYANSPNPVILCNSNNSDSQNCSWQLDATSANAGIFRDETAFSLNSATPASYYDDKLTFSLGGDNDDEWWGPTVTSTSVDIYNRSNTDSVVVKGELGRSQLIVNQTGGKQVEDDATGLGGSLLILAGDRSVSGPSVDFLSGDGSVSGSSKWYLGNPPSDGNENFRIRYTPTGGSTINVMELNEIGYVGVGRVHPTTKLDVAGPVRHGNQNLSGACTAVKDGAVRYHTNKKMQFCDGVNWIDIGMYGVCNGNNVGITRYVGGQLQYCNGSSWVEAPPPNIIMCMECQQAGGPTTSSCESLHSPGFSNWVQTGRDTVNNLINVQCKFQIYY